MSSDKLQLLVEVIMSRLTAWTTSLQDNIRGMSNMIGAVLFFGVVFIAITGLSAVTYPQINDQVASGQAEAIENRFMTLAATGERISQGEIKSALVELDYKTKEKRTGSISTNSESGEVTISIEGQGTIVQNNLGAVEYAFKEERVVYQGGAVFRQSSGGASTPVREAGISTTPGSPGSVSASFIVVENTDQLSGVVEVKDEGPVATDSPVYVGTDDNITISITSEYSRGWKQHLESSFPDTAVIEQSGDTVTVHYGGVPGAETDFYAHISLRSVSVQRR
jgi:hypothetical protein